jgi:LmeA-like phospholipid-binding
MTATPTQVMRSPRPGRRRARRWVIALVIIVVVLVVLDFAARVAAESVMASKIQQQGLQHKPSVTIDGFPFLTQVASKNFQQVNLTDADQTEGPVTITSINATAHNIKLNSYSFSSGTIGSLSGTALISFSSLASTLTQEVGPLGSLLHGAGLDLTAAGPDEVKATMNLVVTSGSATWRVAQLSGNRLNIRLVGSSGLRSSLLGSIQDITVQIPKLPLGLTIHSVQVTSAGVLGRISGSNIPFGS